jgi:ABC-type dipeptide/oligopeptide/nickel transport system ATPase component
MAKWLQGEHVTIVGDTGSGKTYLESKLLQYRSHVIVIRTKPDDVKFPGFSTVKEFKKLGDKKIQQFLFVPKYEEQQLQIVRALDVVWKEGGWCVAVDETYYATQILKLERSLNKLATQGRSKHITLVAGMQRPAWVSRFILSQSTHAFIFRMEGKDLNTLSQSLSPRVVKPVEGLSGHDFIYYNRATREIIKGNARNLKAIFE